jgi:hypothetical protein
LDEAQLKYNIRTSRNYSLRCIPDYLGTSVLSFEIPRHEIGLRTILAEKRHEPLVECEVNSGLALCK